MFLKYHGLFHPNSSQQTSRLLCKHAVVDLHLHLRNLSGLYENKEPHCIPADINLYFWLTFLSWRYFFWASVKLETWGSVRYINNQTRATGLYWFCFFSLRISFKHCSFLRWKCIIQAKWTQSGQSDWTDGATSAVTEKRNEMEGET